MNKPRLRTSVVKSTPPRRARAIRPAHTPGRLNKLEGEYLTTLMLRQQAGQYTDIQFEAMRLTLGKDRKTTYTPDFMVTTAEGHIEFHEVKGHWEDDARVKIKVAARIFPQFRFLAITKVKGVWKTEEF